MYQSDSKNTRYSSQKSYYYKLLFKKRKNKTNKNAKINKIFVCGNTATKFGTGRGRILLLTAGKIWFQSNCHVSVTRICSLALRSYNHQHRPGQQSASSPETRSRLNAVNSDNQTKKRGVIGFTHVFLRSYLTTSSNKILYGNFFSTTANFDVLIVSL